MRRFSIVIVLLVPVLLSLGIVERNLVSADYVTDLRGLYVGRLEVNHRSTSTTLRALPSLEITGDSGHRLTIPAGIYFVGPDRGFVPAGKPLSAGSFRFENVTDAYLPAELWGGGDIEVADFTGDGREDIVFSLWPIQCDSVMNISPRIWVQQETGVFLDETEARMPDVLVPARDIEVLDADSDGDIDIFSTGIQCADLFSINAALFVNDGNGFFSDESGERLPQDASGFAYFAEATHVDSNSSIDLIVNVFGALSTGPEDHQVTKPALWLNDGDGYFSEDTMGRLTEYGNYGFLELITPDVDSDSNMDILFANLSMEITDEQGSVIDSLSGQNALYRNTGNGFFVDETESRVPESDNPDTRDLAAGDIDNDGDPDILEVGFPFGDPQPQVRLLMNDGTGHYSAVNAGQLDSISGWFNDSHFGLLNGDDFPDLFMIRVWIGEPRGDVLFVNNGDGTFSDFSGSLPDVLDFSVSSELFDHEGDGDIDIAIANSGPTADSSLGQNVLYHNQLSQLAVFGGEERVLTEPHISLVHPNPFNPSTTIEFSVPQAGLITLSVYDVLGREVETILNRHMNPGHHTVQWDAGHVPSGIYFVRMRAGDPSTSSGQVFTRTRKVTVLR